MSEDRFLDRLRREAQSLRYQIDPLTSTRLAANIRARLIQPMTVSQFLAAWFRPLAASLTALALAVVLALSLSEPEQGLSLADPIQYSIGGEVYSVGD